ncbi:MAG: hypothetical protein ACXU8N_00435 [Telluria sp.]
MGDAMNGARWSTLFLRLQLALRASGPVAAAGAILLLAGAIAIAVLVPRKLMLEKSDRIALAAAALPAAKQAAAAPPSANENLDLFYKNLGERRYVEQQVRTLFGLAAKSGLALSQGEYRSAYDASARVYTYQVVLPVKGSYKAVWQFAMSALSSIPFASLDDISFRREAIGEPTVEARLRLTLYLAAGGKP